MPKRKRAGLSFSNYHYKPLKPGSGQSRLIRLHPSAVLRDVVKCEIETFEVDQIPSYEAISYAWGNASDVTPIKVGTNHRMMITRSLDSALRYLRHHRDVRLLWADAICINQKDIAEKNETVRQMHNIYTKASQVIVWLGQPVRPWSFRVILDMPDENLLNDQIYIRGKCQLENRLNSNARALVHFSELPWFGRGWVVQEVCFARQIMVQYGRHVMSWEQFEKLGSKLASVLPDFLQYEPLGKRMAYFRLQEAVSGLPLTRFQLRKDGAISMSSILPFARTKSTTDPRDKIFAFASFFPELPKGLKVDYGEDVTSVFVKVARLLVTDMVGLRLLAECESNPSSDLQGSLTSLPSWVPNWAETRTCEPLPGGLSPSPKGHEFAAGSYLVPGFHFQILGDVLLLEAILWDDIVFLDPLASAVGIYPKIAASCLSHLGVNFDDSADGRQHVIISNVECSSTQELYKLCRRVEMCNRDPNGFKIFDPECFEQSSWSAEKYRRIVGRSLMLTTEQYVGWAPSATVPGDVISIIPGCHVPMVLRRGSANDRPLQLSARPPKAEDGLSDLLEEGVPFFRVVGEAYVHGLMEGETVFSMNRASKRSQRIALF